MRYDVIIIGAGLGGLESAYILSKNGYKVCILEQHAQIGGCLQTFRRKTATFDTGFHFVGGLDEGQYLHKLFAYFDLLDLPWHRLDDHAFAEVMIDGKSYYLASGFDRFVDRLSADFPHQHHQLKNYANFLKQLSADIPKSLERFGGGSGNDLFTKSAYEFLQTTISDPLLRSVLSGASLMMELSADKLPLYTFAQINSSFIQSAWRLNGGGSQIADRLAARIADFGGEIITNAKVGQLIEKDGLIKAVEYNNTELLEGDFVISNIHPTQTVALLSQSEHLRNSYRTRISKLKNTYGMFTVHLDLKANSQAYLNRNLFIHEGQDLWNATYDPQRKRKSILLNYQTPQTPCGFTKNIDILTPMHWEEVKAWEASRVGRRGEDYQNFKAQRVADCIELAAKRIPNLKESIEHTYSSSPLTYRDYTGSCQGSAYGVQKDYQDTLHTLLPVQTPIKNLLLTGQNLNLHGVLGVSMTALMTTAHIIGMEKIVKDLK